MEDIIISRLSKKEQGKIQKDLHFIDLITKISRSLNLRAIISGGYAVDGALGKITRFHSDIDILIYGNEKEGRVVLDKLLEEVNKQDSSFVNFEITDKDRQEFYHHFFIQRKGLGAEFYYIEVVGDPFANKKIVAKSDGSFTAEHKFETVKVTLNQVDFEAQSPIVELADRIYKRDIRGDEKRVCHEQDIANLKLITNDLEVEEKLKTLQKR